ncbi:hypothetical protein AURDEDRAFT_156573 [Auricularia subglabra TFB-10046 SS5]|nr:hypothetical protein AURDEDRAFT_156573 [Auricularia subglabra TFB-10046 SS5]
MFTLLASSLLLLCVSAQQTVLSIDTRLTYSSDDWKPGSVCILNKNGTFVGSQGGCIDFGPQPCADLFQYATAPGASVSLKFNGTGIALHTVSQPSAGLANLASEVTVTLDGQDTAYKTEPVQAALKCPVPFSRDGLEGDAEHTITVTLRVAAGAARDDGGPTESENVPFLGIQSFTITDGTSAALNDTKDTKDGRAPRNSAAGLRGAASCTLLMAVFSGILFA